MTRLEPSQYQKDMIDKLVLISENDPVLAEAFRWLDTTKDFGESVDFYNRVLICINQYKTSRRDRNTV